MRIQSLQVKNYGHFNEHLITFGAGTSVVVGPNEAGKSTMLDALSDFLWGIQHQGHPRAFRSVPKLMELDAEVLLNGTTCRYARRLKRLEDSEGNEVGPPWDPANNRDPQPWRSMYGLTLDRLQEGGRLVIAGKGELADLIFLAETGEMLQDIRDDLQERMTRIFRPSGGYLVKSSLDRIKELDGQLKEKESSADAVLKLRDHIAELERQRKALADERLTVERELQRTDELIKCLPHVTTMNARIQELSDVKSSGVVLAANQAEELRSELERRDESAGALERIAKEISDAEEKRATLRLAPEVLACADDIGELQTSLEARRSDRDTVASDSEVKSALAGLRDTLRTLGRMPDDDIEADVRTALIADATRDRLRRLAQKVVSAQEREDALEQDAADAEAEEMAEAEGQDSTLLTEARTKRDQAWVAVRDPWLRGELPDDAMRQELAGDVDRTIVAADTVAEEMAEQLEEAAQARGAANQRALQLQNIRQRLEEARNATGQLVQQWDEVSRECGLPPGVDAAAWRLHDEGITELQSAWSGFEDLQQKRQDAQHRWDAFCAGVAALDALPASTHTDPLHRVEALADTLKSAGEAKAKAEQIDDQLAKLRAEERTTSERLEEAEGRITAVCEGEEEAPEALLERADTARDLRAQIDSCTTVISGVVGEGDSIDTVVADLAETDLVELKSRKADAKRSKTNLDSTIAELDGDLGGQRRELQDVEGREPQAGLNAERLTEGEKLRSLVEEYRQLQVQVALVDAFKEELAQSVDSPILDEAGVYLSRLTDGRYGGFHVVDEGTRRRIEVSVGDPAGADKMQLSELSSGTADQVFLALRLAGLRARQDERVAAGLPTLPVVLDDVLMAHDDVRTESALRLFAELGEQMQIIVLSHHRSVGEAARGIPGITCVDLETVPA